MKAAIAAICLMVATPCTAWEVTRTKDALTDRVMTWARAQSGNATLLVGCLNGRAAPRLVWPARMGWGDVGVSYRIDDGPVIPRIAMVSQDGTTLYPWIASGGAAVMRARRLRVQVGQAFYDFDLVKGEGMPAIRC